MNQQSFSSASLPDKSSQGVIKMSVCSMQSGNSSQHSPPHSHTSCNMHCPYHQYPPHGQFYNYWKPSDMNDQFIGPLPKHYPKSSSISSSSSEGKGQPDYIAWRRLHVSKAKLAGVGEIATFLAGFAVVATVELQINDDANPVLLIAFTVTTALLVCTTMMSIMISTCILPHITVVSKVGHPDAHPHESPHEHMRFFIDLSWVLANTISIFLFTLDVILLCWIKYAYFSKTASYCATAIMIPVLLIIVIFGVVFYRKILQHQSSIMTMRCEELEEMKRQMDLVRGSYTGGGFTHHV